MKAKFLSIGAGAAAAAFMMAALVLACGGGPAPVASPPADVPAAANQGTVPADELDAAIRETSDYFNNQLPSGNKLAILNIQSEYPALSEYIIDELIANIVNDRVFSVVDRQQLNAIRAELDFQMSGEVDDNTAQELGRLAGAQIIVSGAVSQIGDLYRLRVRALSVESARIEGQFNRNIPAGPTVAALVKSRPRVTAAARITAGPRPLSRPPRPPRRRPRPRLPLPPRPRPRPYPPPRFRRPRRPPTSPATRAPRGALSFIQTRLPRRMPRSRPLQRTMR
jgi:hypothetical protein